MWRKGKKLAQLARLWASNQIQSDTDDDATAQNIDEALSIWGLQIDGQSPPPGGVQAVFYIWPKNLATWQLWQRLQSMWRSGMCGRDGLDWPSVVAWLRHAERMGSKEIASAMHCLQAMEIAALNVWADQREKQADKSP